PAIAICVRVSSQSVVDADVYIPLSVSTSSDLIASSDRAFPHPDDWNHSGLRPKTSRIASRYQQILGNSSPAGMSSTCVLSSGVRMSTQPCSSAWTRPIVTAPLPSGCDQEQHLPLVGHQQRVQPKDLAGPPDQFGNRDGRFFEQDAGTGGLGD